MAKISEKFIVYTDGGARGNPGPAAVGVVIQDAEGKVIKSFGESLGIATNNEAEYRAVARALEKIKALIGGARAHEARVEMRMYSELVARQLTGQYKIEEERLFPLFIKIWNLKLEFNNVQFHHIRREQNRDADRLVNEALDREQMKLFS